MWIRAQYSVFLCRLDYEGVEDCCAKLLEILDKFDDKKEPDNSLIIFERFDPDSMDCLLGDIEEKSSSKFLII